MANPTGFLSHRLCCASVVPRYYFITWDNFTSSIGTFRKRIKNDRIIPQKIRMNGTIVTVCICRKLFLYRQKDTGFRVGYI